MGLTKWDMNRDKLDTVVTRNILDPARAVQGIRHREYPEMVMAMETITPLHHADGVAYSATLECLLIKQIPRNIDNTRLAYCNAG